MSPRPTPRPRLGRGDPPVSALTRRVGGLHLVVAGVANGATGVALLVRGWLAGLLVGALPAVVDEVALVANAPLVLSFLAWAPLLGVLLLAVGGVQAYSGWHAYHARGWGRGVGAALAGVANPLTLPVALVAAALLVLSKPQFAPPDGEG